MSLQVYLKDGLGNRLFQYAAVKGIAKKYNLHFKVYAVDNNTDHNLNEYKWLIDKIAPYCFQVKRNILHYNPQIRLWYQPTYQHIGYHEPLKEHIINKVLVGYFQSEKYFENIADELRQQLKEPSVITPILNNYLNIIRIPLTNLCIIHVRLKDKVNDSRHFIHYGKYYSRTIATVREKNPSAFFLILSETPQEIQQIYPTLLKDLGTHALDYAFVPRQIYNPIDFFDFYLITRVPTVISSCSTFVWWAAWLNTNLDKQIYLPSRFLNDSENNCIYMKGAQIIDVN
jgi:hypothetical protein